jgi:alpha-beta hydrolase superfamily lysophospholipase
MSVGFSMEHREGTFSSVRNIKIFYQAWLPSGDVKAVLLVVHGLGEHSGRYMNVVNHFVPLGYAVYGLDHVGHGKTEGGPTEVIESFDDLMIPLTTYYNMVKSWQPGKPIFLLGHSLGGLIATYYLIDHQADFKGAIISAPAIKLGESITPITITLAKILSKIAPKMGLQSLNVSTISRDPSVVTAYVNDPLVFHGKSPARIAAEAIQAMQRTNAEMHKITLPFITVQGSDDKLVDPGGAQMLYDKASSEDKTLKIYPGYYHEVFNEPEKNVVLKDVETWLAAHL